MNAFNKINNIVGWIVTVIACSVYILTAEAGGSLWDCGEFVSSCFKLQIPHPPGAPLFVILGRLFIIIHGDDPLTAAKSVNIMSALASGFTIMFLFWTITHFSRKIVQKSNEVLSGNQIFTIMSAGVVGALAYTFSDSFWYSAVEGEVYALSSFFTALVFWMMLKWEHAAGQPGADKWIILIFFMMGLSIGVHLLNLLTIPAIVMVYYYKRYKSTKWGTFWASIIGCIITGVTQKVVIQYTIKSAGQFDIFFVNSLGLPFFSGFATYFVALIALIYFGIKISQSSKITTTQFGIWLALFSLSILYPFVSSGSSGTSILKLIVILGGAYAAASYGLPALKRNPYFLKLSMWSFAFMLLGYSTYLTTMIRSGANPSIDMYNVDNPMSLEGYLGREQYGDFPLLYGQVFTAKPVDYEEGEMKFVKGKDKYLAVGKEQIPVYEAEDKMLLPRVWDASNDQGHATFYQRWLNLEDGEKPTMAHNISWALSYQIGWMYLRYFGWNFIGKQNDLQGFGNVRDANTITGIKAIDNAALKDQGKLPSSIQDNKANNKLYALPFILGLLGIFYQYNKDKKGSFVSFLLFFFTGLAIVFYLNQAGNQPRERDYAYVGSFYAFSIWIGLGVMQIKDWLAKFTGQSVANASAALICLLAVPTIMAAEEWDDHDRSKKQTARDLAKNYLESCPPNAILFSFGDNDTYPLWYAQEVEGIRKDIRVINYSLLGIDWYINQLRYKLNNSAPIDVIWSAEQIEGGKRDYVRFYDRPGVSDQNRYVDLYSLMHDFVGSDDPANQLQMQDGTMMNYLPVKKVSVPVDAAAVRKNGIAEPSDSVLSEIRFDIPKDILMKNDLAVLNIIAANKWNRPICFTSPFGELGFATNLRVTGQVYQLVPLVGQNMINSRASYDVLKNKFAYGNAHIKGVYFDEENRRHLIGIRQAYAEAANQLVIEGQKEKAIELLNICDKNFLQENFPYALVSRQNIHNTASTQFLEAAIRAGDKKLDDKVAAALKKDLNEQLAYYAYLGDMSVAELQQAVQDLMANKADNLSNNQRQMFMEIRQAVMLVEYIRSLEAIKN
ncbi:MAG: DUF2723 domain-containing protein [Bacteroidota bacterium]